MLLQPDYQCHLTQSDDVAISERVFLTEVYLNSSEEALQYKQIDQTEYERLKRQQDALSPKGGREAAHREGTPQSPEPLTEPLRQTLFPAVFPSFGGKKHLQVPDTGLPASNMHFSCPQISDMHLPVHY